MLGNMGQLQVDTTPPNTRYKSQNLGTWSSAVDVDDFLYRCCHDTGYYGATIGSYVTINDGSYNKQWVIAGFDCEKNHKASDGSIRDNGYGICLIPKSSLGSVMWDYGDNNTNYGYYGSTMNKTTLPEVANNLKKIFGDHLVQRNVLLSDSTDYDNEYADSYVWTTAYCTLMSAGQVTGTFASNRNKYDDGEANYKLPLFNYEKWSFVDDHVWLRGIYGYDSKNDYHHSIYVIFRPSGNLGCYYCKVTNALRPLIYIR